MPDFLRNIARFFFPAECCNCGNVLVGDERQICVKCFSQLPFLDYADIPGNPIEQCFYGRVPIVAGFSLLSFKKSTVSQTAVHQKYTGNVKFTRLMGLLMGERLAASPRFADVDMLIPVPLHSAKQRQRGYNQCLELCKGISKNFNRPINTSALKRMVPTETQTHKSRIERSDNIQGAFQLKNPEQLMGRHVLLVDDVLTSGSTLESCCSVLQNVPNIRISVATLAIAL